MAKFASKLTPNFIGVLPNFTVEEYFQAISLLKNGQLSAAEETRYIEEFTKGLEALWANKSQVILLDSARSAFYFLLQQLNLASGSEVVITSFTCVVIVNPILWSGLKPVYVDIESQNFNTTVSSIIAGITDKTKLILVQHTFGLAFPVKELQVKLQEMGRSDIIIVEDLAHALGQGELGGQGDFSVISFGIEKAISTVRGGALLINPTFKDRDNSAVVLGKLQQSYSELEFVSYEQERRLLLNVAFWRITLPVYYWGLGKFTLGRLFTFLGHKLGLLGIAIGPDEYAGGKAKNPPGKLRGKLAALGILQLRKLLSLNTHRRNVAHEYAKGLADTRFAQNAEQKFLAEIFAKNQPHGFLRYPLMLDNRSQRASLLAKARTQRLVLGDWYRTMFYTKPEFLGNLGYKSGQCPITEDVSERIINLPTSINTTPEHIIRIIKLLETV